MNGDPCGDLQTARIGYPKGRGGSFSRSPPQKGLPQACKKSGPAWAKAFWAAARTGTCKTSVKRCPCLTPASSRGSRATRGRHRRRPAAQSGRRGTHVATRTKPQLCSPGRRRERSGAQKARSRGCTSRGAPASGSAPTWARQEERELVERSKNSKICR